MRKKKRQQDIVGNLTTLQFMQLKFRHTTEVVFLVVWLRH